jgi:hypothetical protein
MDQEEYVKLMGHLHMVFIGRKKQESLDSIEDMAKKVNMDPWDYVMTASERYHKAHSNTEPKNGGKVSFTPPKIIPTDAKELEPWQWYEWMKMTNWEYEGTYHGPEWTKEAFTGISRFTGDPVKNSFGNQTWKEVVETGSKRTNTCASAIEVFIKWLKTYARSSV